MYRQLIPVSLALLTAQAALAAETGSSFNPQIP
jgi:hypothetical protein